MRESNAIFFFDGYKYIGITFRGEILFILSLNHFYSYRVRMCVCARERMLLIGKNTKTIYDITARVHDM